MNTRNRTLALALTIAFVALPLGVVEAQPPPPSPHAIHLEETETTAGRTQQGTQRTVTVLNNDDPAAGRKMFQVVFSVDTKGGTGADPLRAINWVQSLSSGPPGWNVVVNNGAPRKVTFTAPAGSHVDPGDPTQFTLGFDVIGNPAHGESFVVNVKGQFSPDMQETPAAERYTINIDGSPPAILPSGVITVDRKAGNADGGNGKLDHLVVYFDERLDRTSLEITDFKIFDNSRSTPLEYDITNFRWLEPVDAGAPIVVGGHTFGECPDASGTEQACEGLEIAMAEGFGFDTGVKPDLTAANPSLTDVGGNTLRPVRADSVIEVDGAHPVLVSALAKDLEGDGSSMEGMAVTFSEDVRGSAGGSGISLTTLDFDYLDINCPTSGCTGSTSGNPNDHGGTATDWLVVHPPGDAAADDLHLAEVQFSSNGNAQPLNAFDVNKVNPDRLQCALGMVRDLSSSDNGEGLLCLQKEDVADVTPVRIPGVFQAEINIGQFKVTVEFDVPVSDASGDNVPVRADAFDIVPTDGGGPQGIDQVVHTACTTKVVVHLDQPATPTDVDETPSHVRINENAIKGCRSGAANPLFVPPGDVPLQDLTPPAVMTAHTVDEDSNGIIDGYLLQFSEPIDDRSFCGGLERCPNLAEGGLVQLVDRNSILDLSTFSNFTWDSDLAVDDRFGVLRWDENDGVTLDSGAVPDLWIGPDPNGVAVGSLFVDLSKNGLGLKSTVEDIEAKLAEADGAPPVIWLAQTVDRETRLRDEPTGQGTRCTVGVERLCEADPDGLIDGYRLIFSEPVKDETFRSEDWKVADRRVSKDPVKGPITEDTLIKEDIKDDERVILAFCEHPVDLLVTGDTCKIRDDLPRNFTATPDTILKPELTYAQPPAPTTGVPPGVADLAGNRMLTVDPKKVIEQDGARPVIFRVEGFVNQTVLKVFFSEPVDDGQGEVLVRRDFIYSNGNSLPDDVPVSQRPAEKERLDDRASGLDNNVEVQHKPGDDVAILAVNRPLTAMDIRHDRIAANFDSIRETSPTVLRKQFALPVFKPVNKAVDLVDPGEVDLEVDQLDANSVTLRWTAPGDDGGTQGDTVCGYVFNISDDAIMLFTRNDTLVDGVPQNVLPDSLGDRSVTVTYDPGDADGEELAAPGATQRATIAGLDPETAYYFGVLAVDCDHDGDGVPLVGALGTTITANTLEDSTLPQGSLNLRSTTHPANRPVLVRTAQFQWDHLTDPQSTVVYHYVLDDQPDTQVTQDDASTTGNSVKIDLESTGTWYFHIRGFSGGGGQPATTMYKIVYGHGSLGLAEILEYNIQLHESTNVTREGEANIIRWQLPPVEGLGELQAVRIWRLEEGRYQLLDTVEGDHARLSVAPNNAYRDDSEGAFPEARYAVDAVFLTDQHGGDVSLATFGPIGAELQESDPTPVWVWFALAGALLLIIGGIIAFALVRARHVPPPSYLDEVGVDEETGLPSHSVTCPTCSHGFSAVGHAPLEITCPECGTKGVLE